jgi:HlyD family secretion protein
MNETGNNQTTPNSLSERVRSLRLTDSSESAGGALWWLPWTLCVVLVLAVGFLALEAFSPIDDEMVKKLADERGLNLGKTDTQSAALAKLGVSQSAGSKESKIEISLEAKGYIVPFSLIQVSPKISGTVMKLYIKEGMAVKKNELLAEIEDIEYKADLDHSVGAVESAQGRVNELVKFLPDEVNADLEDAKAQYEQMRLKYERTDELKKRQAVAIEDIESAKSMYDSTKYRLERLRLSLKLLTEGTRMAKIEAAKGELALAKADLDKAKWRKENTIVRAPVDGIVLSKKTEEGNIVNPLAFSNGLSASLCEMADLHNLEVDLSIAERDISRLFADQDCRIRAEAFPERIYKGRVSRIMPTGDRSKSSISVRVKIDFPAFDVKGQVLPMDEQGQFLRPEMGAIVTFLNRKAPTAQK